MKCHRIITSYFSRKPVTMATIQRIQLHPKIESYCVFKRTGRWNLLKLLYYMLLEMIFKICKFKKIPVGQMKEKTCFSTIAFLFFSHLQNFLKIGVYTHPIDLSCHQKFEKNSLTWSENIGAQSWKIWKCNSRLDPTLRMREVVHARAKRPESIRTYSLWQGDSFPFDRFMGYKKSSQSQLGRVLPFAFALTCYKIYLLS